MGAISEVIENNPKEIKRLLGIDQEPWQQLIYHAELLHQRKQEEIERKKVRVNQKGVAKNLNYLPKSKSY